MVDKRNKHLVIVRTSGSCININTYNCQELGLAKALYKKGLRVSLVLAGENNRKISIAGIDVYYCRFIAVNQQIAWFYGLSRLLTSLKPTYVQVHDVGLLMSWKVVIWAQNHNIPSFLIQGNYELTRKPLFRQLEYIYNMTFGRYVLTHVTGIGCKTPRAENYLKSYKKRSMLNTYIGLDTTKFDNEECVDWRKKLNLTSKKILLYIGSLEPRRNPVFLLQILASLPDDYVLLIAGTGPLQDEVNIAIGNYGLDKRCWLLGKLKQNELPSLYKASDLFLLPSSYEIYGMVILESLFFGLPVISSKTAGSECLIEDSTNGYIIPSFDHRLWKSTILKYFDNPDNSKFMRNRAQEMIKEKYIWDKASENFMNLYIFQ